MTEKHSFLIFCIILLGIISNGYSERTKDKMYDNILGSSSCYRRLNATHQIGCSSKRGGSTGAIHFCDTQKDLDFIIKNGKAEPYIPVIPAPLFTTVNLDKLIKSEIISGLVIYKPNETAKYFTHDEKCPNNRFSIEGTCVDKNIWNPHGTGLLFRDIPFPVFYVENDTDTLKLRDCFVRFNNFTFDSQRERSLCSLQLKAFMYATTDTPTCQRRSNLVTNLNPVKFCDALGDSNIWSSLFPLVEGGHNDSKPIRNVKYIIIAARMDTTSLFEKTVGASSPVTGIVALLAVAKLLKAMLPDNPGIGSDKNVLFMLFNGETYDYIGSQRMLYDMAMGNFPIDAPANNSVLPIIKLEDISMFVELSQLGSKHNEVFAHYLKDNSQISSFLKKLAKNNPSGLNLQSVSDSLPPASLHTFLKDDQNFPGIILADHQTEYVNQFYNSIFDDTDKLDYYYYNATDESEESTIPNDSIQRYVGRVATLVALSVYEDIKGVPYSGDEVADVIMIDDLFHCYLENPNCRVYRAVQRASLPKTPFSLYVGVKVVSNFATTLTSLTLGWFTGDKQPVYVPCSNQPRNYAYKFYNMSDSIFDLGNISCYKVTLNVTDAVSPAFIIDDYDWLSGKYSSWSESTWEDFSMRIFLKPSAAHENMTIAIGSMSLIFSFIIVYFFKSRSHVLFTTPIPTTDIDSPTNC